MPLQGQHLQIDAHHQDQVASHLACYGLMVTLLEELPAISFADQSPTFAEQT